MRCVLVKFLLGVALSSPLAFESACAVEKQEAEWASYSIQSDDPAALVSESPDVETGKIETEMGAFRDVFTVKTLPRKGSEVRWRLPVRPGASSLVLEIQEIHSRRPEAFGYTVLVNDREVYFRTYQELGAGPNHYFVEVPGDLLDAGSPLVLELRHEGGGPFSVGKVWMHEDFFERVAERENISRPMAILFPTSSIRLDGETDQNRRKDPEAELERFRKMKELYSGFQDYGPAGVLAFAGGYGHIDPVVGRKELWELVDLSSRAGMPGLWLINGTGWGGKPTGPDGLGGFFSDLQYTRTVWKPSTGSWEASWPNMWANTPGAALRNPVMNDFLEVRFQQMLDGLLRELARRRLEGTPSESMLIREFAPASGEISQAVIESAARDGIELNPVDGLDSKERLWLHRDAVKTWQELAESTVRAVGRDVVVVDNGRIQLPGEQLFDNLYAHPDFLTEKPMNDPCWSGGQHGMVDGLWSSGEMGEGKNFRDIASYDYLRARGKLSMINMERTILKEDFSVMKRHYERGFQFLCFFNADPGDEKFVKAVDGIANDPIDPAVHRQPVLLEFKAEREESAHSKALAVENLKIHNGLRLAVADVSKPGEALYRMSNSGDPFGAALALEMEGRISPGEGNRIVVMLGDSPESLQIISTVTETDLPDPDHWTPYMTSRKLIDLGGSISGKTEAFLKLVFHAEHAPDAAFLLGFDVQTQWPKASGHLSTTTLTKARMRTLQLWVQERAIAGRLLEKYRLAGGADDEVWKKAKDLFQRGWYRSANRLLSGAISELPPATYLVRGHGRLGRHPVELKLEKPDDQAFITLEKAEPRGFVFHIDPARDGLPITISLPGESSKWKLTELNGGRWELAPFSRGNEGPYRIVARKNSIPPAALPSKIVGRFLGRSANTIEIDTQDLKVMNYASRLKLPLASDAVFTRRAHREADSAAASSGETPQPFDAVEVQLNEKGEAVRLDATYGFARGKIKAFHPPSVVGKPSNGAIELEDGTALGLVFERQATLFDTVALQGQVLSYELRHLPLAIKSGDSVEVRYTPPQHQNQQAWLLSVKQPRRLLLDVDYTAYTDGDWRKSAHAVQGVDVRPHKPEPNYLYRVVMPLLRPTEAFVPGSVTYRISSEKPLGTTVAEIAARAFDDSSRVTVLVSPDGQKWTRCGQFDNTWQNNISQTLDQIPYQFIDLTPAVKGLKSFYLKLELAMNSADHRFCVAKLRVATESPDLSLP